MINKIKHHLNIQFTTIIVIVLVGLVAFCAFIQKRDMILFTHNSLEDYLEIETWEAREEETSVTPDLHYTIAKWDSFEYFTLWYKEAQLIHAELPDHPELSKKILKSLTQKNFKNRKFHKRIFKVQDEQGKKQKWVFEFLKHSIQYKDGKKGEIIVAMNSTPIHQKNHEHVWKMTILSLLLVGLSYVIGAFLVKKSMTYIVQNIERQKQFTSNAAHELRTPLSIILGNTEILEYQFENNKHLKNIQDEVEYVSHLLDSLLLIAKSENNQIQLNKTSFDFSGLIKNYIASLETVIGTGILTFTSNTFSNITADATLLRQLLSILVDNALKYTSDIKKIKINLEEDKNDFILSVSDNGIGLTSQELEHIFERFWQADKSHHKKGLGLGLCLAQTIVQLQKGKIEIESVPHKGTTFKITLPKA